MDRTCMAKLKYNAEGLIPAIVQDAVSGDVLMFAYMNEESLNVSINEGYTCFFSRSRQCLWRKGETSGNKQKIVRIKADCDYDTLLVEVIPDGPACHTGETNCFFNDVEGTGNRFSLSSLYSLLEGRQSEMPEGSYTTYLFEQGREKILKKIGEESSEVIIAAMKGSREETIFEAADLAYHMLVLLCDMRIAPEDILAELKGRHVVDKKVKQESMQ